MRTLIYSFSVQILVFIGIVFLFSCDDDAEDSVPSDEVLINSELAMEFKENYAAIVFASYQDAYNEALKLQNTIEALVTSPSETALNTAKDAWISSREPYGQTEAYRFSNGPIDDDNGPEFLLNSWPLDEGWIDYVEGNSNSGIVNNLDQQLSKEFLIRENGRAGENNISIGYHAVEFLLWGQDLTNPSENLAGRRPFTDYVIGEEGSASNQARRAEYLSICSELLLDHLQLMIDAWDPSGTANYRSRFVDFPDNIAIKNIFSGIGQFALIEIASERMNVALASRSQEDEQSCFSDNTHRDIRTNILGVKNIYTGAYTRTDGSIISGASLSDLVEAVNADLDNEIISTLNTTVSAIDATGIPFDLAVSDDSERDKVFSAVLSLQNLANKLDEAAEALGL